MNEWAKINAWIIKSSTQNERERQRQTDWQTDREREREGQTDRQIQRQTEPDRTREPESQRQRHDLVGRPWQVTCVFLHRAEGAVWAGREEGAAERTRWRPACLLVLHHVRYRSFKKHQTARAFDSLAGFTLSSTTLIQDSRGVSCTFNARQYPTAHVSPALARSKWLSYERVKCYFIPIQHRKGQSGLSPYNKSQRVRTETAERMNDSLN